VLQNRQVYGSDTHLVKRTSGYNELPAFVAAGNWTFSFPKRFLRLFHFLYYKKLSAVEDAGLSLLYNLSIFNGLLVVPPPPAPNLALLLLFCIVKILYLPALFIIP